MTADAIRRAALRGFAAGVVLASAFAAGCAVTPVEGARPLQMPADALQMRSLQSRRIDGIDEPALLAAVTTVLQDLGYTIGRTDAVLGLVSASTKRSAFDTAQIVTEILVTSLLDVIFHTVTEADIDAEQDIYASVVTRPARGQDGAPEPRAFVVRITLQRRVWNTEGELQRSEPVKEAKIYQQFFDALSKSVFLELQAL